jgi:hypothetical protein
VLEWENAEFVGTIGLWEGGQLKLKNSSAIELSGQVEGVGMIEKDANSTGDLLLKGNNSRFSGIFKLSSGTAIVEDENGTQYFTGITSITSKGVLVLGQGAEVVGGHIELWDVSGDMNTAGTLNMTKENESIAFSTSAVLGNGIINKSGNTVLNIVGDCTGFTGTFFESQERTVVRGGYFTGYSSITEQSVLEMASGSDLSGGGTIGLWNTGVMDITTPGNLTFSSGITGTAGTKITKAGTGTLELSGDNSGFQGLYWQNNGTTTINGKYFIGYSSITGQSVLEMANGSDLSGGGTIGLWDTGIMNIKTEKDLEHSRKYRGRRIYR